MFSRKFCAHGKNVALHKAIKSRDYEETKELIEAGADVNFKLQGSTPLMEALTNNMTRCIPDMVRAGADVNIADRSDRTPLMYAAQEGDGMCVNLFTRVGLDMNVYVNDVWRTSVCYFGRGGEDPLIVRRIELHVTPEEEYRYMRYVKNLVKSGADVNKVDRSGWTALFYALSSEHNRHECVRTLLNSGADVNKVDRNGNTALTVAAHYGDYEALMMLLEAGADVNVGSALHAAVSGNGRTMLESPCQNLHLLISRRVPAISRNLQFIETLIAAGADVNAVNQQGHTPLMCAAHENDLNLVTFFLRAEASINEKDKYGKNALVLNGSSYFPSPVKQQVSLLLIAAGETIDGTTFNHIATAITKHHSLPASLTANDLSIRLLPLCRETIRNHLMSLDPHTHLFIRVPKLGLPSLLRKYLLYDVALEPQQKKYKID